MPHTAPTGAPCRLKNTAADSAKVGDQNGLASMWLKSAILKNA